MEKVLIVDDEPEILKAFHLRLKGRFDVALAQNGTEGLEQVKKNGPYAVILSDYNMPDMSGIEFLSKTRQIHPDSVRIVITGCADLAMAIVAVNEGNIYRFITKPCKSEYLVKTIEASIRKYRLIVSERELLENTLNGAIKFLFDMFAILSPDACSWVSRITRYVKKIAALMEVPDQWCIETAARLSQIGSIILSKETVIKRSMGLDLTENENKSLEGHPAIAAELIRNIPRMEQVANIVAYQEKGFDGSGLPEDPVKGDGIPIGSRILKAVLDFNDLKTKGVDKLGALKILNNSINRYDPVVLHYFEKTLDSEDSFCVRYVKVKDLSTDMIIAEDVRTSSGALLIARDHEITASTIQNLKQFSAVSNIKEPIQVFVPVDHEAACDEPVHFTGG